MPQGTRIQDTGVLVLGAGLAGLWAAMAARRARPDVPVCLAWCASGASGSSFANVNDALGIQVPKTDAEREDFERETLALAAPGYVAPVLVRILAQDAETRFAELAADAHFRTDDQGALLRFPGCFSTAPRAFIFTGLPSLFRALAGKAQAAGVRLLPDHRCTGLLADATGIHGALLQGQGGPVILRARTVVAALGGPAPLFARNMAGPGNPGEGLGLLAQAGAALGNCGFLQWFWADEQTGNFRSPAALLAPGAALLRPGGGTTPVPDDKEFEALRDSRKLHCPATHATPDSPSDARLDALLLDHADTEGVIRIIRNGQEQSVILRAHASNGGAIIDASGQTTVPRLFACGECATGMHGANRLGGASVLSALVFGRRAGVAAAELADNAESLADTTQSSDDHLLHLAGEIAPPAPLPPELSLVMGTACALGGQPGLAALQSDLLALPARPATLAALAIVTSQLRHARNHTLNTALEETP